MDQIGVDLFYDLLQTQHILRQITPAKFVLSTCPLNNLYAFRHRAIFRLPEITFQPNVEHLMPAISNCGEKAVVVGAVVVGEIDDSHGENVIRKK
jgi:hypothetical protein